MHGPHMRAHPGQSDLYLSGIAVYLALAPICCVMCLWTDDDLISLLLQYVASKKLLALCSASISSVIWWLVMLARLCLLAPRQNFVNEKEAVDHLSDRDSICGLCWSNLNRLRVVFCTSFKLNWVQEDCDLVEMCDKCNHSICSILCCKYKCRVCKNSWSTYWIGVCHPI